MPRKKRKDPVERGPREWSPRKRKYTVIGLWADNNQPWLEWGEGFSPQDGLRDALQHAMKENDWDIDYMEDLFVIEVLEGHQKGILRNRYSVSGKDALNEDYEVD